jgi:carotenoid cleavage dioxygenase-like enzyme
MEANVDSRLEKPAVNTWWERSDNLTLKGNYAPITEEMSVEHLTVEGEIPASIDGLFLRNGPNQQFEPPGRYHPFDGDGMIHSVRIRHGQVSYRNRWVVSRQLAYERKIGRGVYYGMNNGFRPPDPEHAMRAGIAKNVANISVAAHGGRLLAVSENGPPLELDYDLNTRGTARFGDKKLDRFTGHPHKLPDSDELVAFGYSPFPPYLRYYLIDCDGSVVTNDVIDIPDPVMIHDLCIAGDQAIFLDAPAIFDLSGGASGTDFMRWAPERGTRFGVLPIHGRGWDTLFFEADPCYIYHYYNGERCGNLLTFYAECMDRVATEYPDNPEDARAAYGYTTRFTIDLSGNGKVKRERVADFPIVLPVIDTRQLGKGSRYGYAVSFDHHDLDHWRYLTRTELATGNVERWDFGSEAAVSEAAFIEDSTRPREEDGYLGCFVYDRRTHSSSFQLLRAGALSDGPIARVALPQRIPHGFHATWLPAWEM